MPPPRAPKPLQSRNLTGAPRRGVVVTDPAGRPYIAPLDEGTTFDPNTGGGGGGTGDVVGPASAVDDRIATFDGATGKLIQDGGKTIAGVLADADTAADAGDAAVLLTATGYTDSELAAHAADPDAHKGQKHSIELDAGDLQLENDTASPGNNKVYGTDGSGVRGWKADPTGGSGTIDGTLTATRVPFAADADTLDDDAAMTWDDTVKKLVIATAGQTLDAQAQAKIHIGGDFAGAPTFAGHGVLVADGYGAAPSFVFRSSLGTQASKSALAANSVGLDFSSQLYDGSQFNISGRFRFTSDGAQSGTNRGAYFQILLTALNSLAAAAEVLRVTGRGNILLNQATEPSTGTGALIVPDGTVPATMGSNTAGVYGDDVGGTTELFGINEAGVKTQLTGVAPKTRQITAVIGDGINVITTGAKGYVSCPFSGTITGARLLSTDPAALTGSIVIDVWKDTYANYPPTVADTITASAKPTLSSARKSDDTTLTGWTTTVTAGDVFGFNVDSVTTVKQVTLQLTIVLT